MSVPIIDLFAGPGGLGEGFSSIFSKDKKRIFKIKLSIEKDAFAHETLRLRAFYRQFAPEGVPQKYYDHLEGGCSLKDLYEEFPSEFARANSEAWHAELGSTETPDSTVDEKIVSALGRRTNWLLIGGPPCQAYSIIGRSRIIGKNGVDKYEQDHRHFLYKQYLRIIAKHRPAVFVMENVKGLLSAKIGGVNTFERITRDLKDPLSAIEDEDAVAKGHLSYKLLSLVVDSEDGKGDISPNDFLIESEQFGIPQARHRLIILGVRHDVVSVPKLLRKCDQVTVKEVISDLPRLRSGLSREIDSITAWRNVLSQIESASWLYDECMTSGFREEVFAQLDKINNSLGRGGEFVPQKKTPKPSKLSAWYYDPRMKGVCNHVTREHIGKDLHRYFFVSVFAKVYGRSPKLHDFPKELLPAHKNVTQGVEERKFNDRFRVQVATRPSTTVTSHISKDGHYFIHHDPVQCRSLTVREAARLQTFPDNYLFKGTRTQQYQQVGNAVPPLLAKKIASIVAGLFSTS